MWDKIKSVFTTKPKNIDSSLESLKSNQYETQVSPMEAKNAYEDLIVNGVGFKNKSNIAENNFKVALSFTLSKQIEGGYVNHPNDPGGATNRGVTQNVYNAWRKRRGEALQSVKRITHDEAVMIYKEDYWFASNADDVISTKVAVALFDAAVNLGVGRAVSFLQQCLGTHADGVWGPQTTFAYENAVKNIGKTQLLDCFLSRRDKWYETLNSQTTWGKKFIKGWRNRMTLLRRLLLTLNH